MPINNIQSQTTVCVSTDENLEELVNLQKIANGVLTKESNKRVFIQDPPWVSSLFMNSLFVRAKQVLFRYILLTTLLDMLPLYQFMCHNFLFSTFQKCQPFYI